MKIKVSDDGGNLHEIDPATDVGGALLILEYARARGFKVGPMLQVGGVVMQVSDTRQESGRSHDEPVDEDMARVMGLRDD